MDGLAWNFESSAEFFDEGVGSSFLAVGRIGGFGIANDTYTDSLSGPVPVSSRNQGPLSLPFFSFLYLSVAATESVADDKMTVEVFRICMAA